MFEDSWEAFDDKEESYYECENVYCNWVKVAAACFYFVFSVELSYNGNGDC